MLYKKLHKEMQVVEVFMVHLLIILVCERLLQLSAAATSLTVVPHSHEKTRKEISDKM